MPKVGHIVTRPGRREQDPPVEIPVAEELETVPGIPKHESDLEFYSREYPLETINIDERASRDWANRIRDGHLEMREIRREHDRLNKPIVMAGRMTGEMEPTSEPVGEDITELVKAKARSLGFGEVGITRYDHHYTYVSKKDWVKFPHAICLAYEQDYEPTQSIPSVPAEIVHSSTYRTEGAAGLELGNYIRSLGFRAQVHSPNDNTGPYIPMFVEAGLGQLGANGQLLSPHFGSRARLMVITTDASVTYDKPVDYGIHQFCNICQVCANRCPGRAIIRDKIWWRGAEKNKLIFKRCRPVMARYLGCGICMKVCPIQKYGMKPVMEHYISTGEVLGKGTNGLEGYELRDQGYFGPGELPTFDGQFFNMPHGKAEDWVFEQFKDKLMDAGGLETPAGDDAVEEFKGKLSMALALDQDAFGMGDDENPDYI